MKESVPSTERLPCGCLISFQDDMFIYECCPKAEACEWYQYVRQVGEELGIGSTILDFR